MKIHTLAFCVALAVSSASFLSFQNATANLEVSNKQIKARLKGGKFLEAPAGLTDRGARVYFVGPPEWETQVLSILDQMDQDPDFKFHTERYKKGSGNVEISNLPILLVFEVGNIQATSGGKFNHPKGFGYSGDVSRVADSQGARLNDKEKFKRLGPLESLS